MLAMDTLSTTVEFDKVKIQERTSPKPTVAEITDQFCLDQLAQHIFDKCKETAEDTPDEVDFTVQENGNTKLKPQKIGIVALQFPDYMLPDSPFAVEVLQKLLDDVFKKEESWRSPLVYILADTSYSPCCVDTVAAKHVSADMIVHFGNACLNPVNDIPVVYIFGKQVLDLEKIEARFQEQYGDANDEKILFMYDPEYEHALTGFADKLQKRYPGLVPTYIQKPGNNDNSEIIPARPEALTSGDLVTDFKIPARIYPKQDEEDLTTFSIFYVISPNPSSSLLLHLTTLVKEVHLLEAPSLEKITSPHHSLMRRYRYMNMTRTASTIGILINTLSLRDIGPALKTVQGWILAASKKSYTFVVGKPNVPKLANFDVIDVWVVLGCPLGGIIVDCEEYYKPIITPYELKLALQATPTWTGKWLISLQAVMDNMKLEEEAHAAANGGDSSEEEIDEDAPIFDVVTGKYVSTARPLRRRLEHVDIQSDDTTSNNNNNNNNMLNTSGKKSLTVKHSSQLVIRDTVSTAADHLYNKLTWTGLGSDFSMDVESDEEEAEFATVEKGRGGIARGYKVHEDEDRT